VLQNIIRLARHLSSASIAPSAVGIGIAGVLDSRRTTLLESPNLPQLHNAPLKELLESELRIPVLLENDANCGALGELWAGAGRALDNFLFFTIGTGIGAGLILNGRLWSGENGKAGEFGHVIVNPSGAQCACGRHGCLEAHASGSAITRLAREGLAQGRQTSLQSLLHDRPDAVTPESVYHEAVKGDRFCLDIFHEAARFLAIGIANVNNLLDIHSFIIGGGVSKALHLVEGYLLNETRQRVFGVSKERIHVSLTKLGNDAGIYGAGYVARELLALPEK
jgi:glucokinase